MVRRIEIVLGVLMREQQGFVFLLLLLEMLLGNRECQERDMRAGMLSVGDPMSSWCGWRGVFLVAVREGVC